MSANSIIKYLLKISLSNIYIQYANMLRVNPFKPRDPIKGTLANSVDQDQTPQNVVSDQGLHCLYLVQKFLLNMIIKKN